MIWGPCLYLGSGTIQASMLNFWMFGKKGQKEEGRENRKKRSRRKMCLIFMRPSASFLTEQGGWMSEWPWSQQSAFLRLLMSCREMIEGLTASPFPTCLHPGVCLFLNTLSSQCSLSLTCSVVAYDTLPYSLPPPELNMFHAFLSLDLAHFWGCRDMQNYYCIANRKQRQEKQDFLPKVT